MMTPPKVARCNPEIIEKTVDLPQPEGPMTASVFAVLSGIIGSLYPSIKAAAQDPVEALAYE